MLHYTKGSVLYIDEEKWIDGVNSEDFFEGAELLDFTESIQFATFVMGSVQDDNLNENDIRKHLFRLNDLFERLSRMNRHVQENKNALSLSEIINGQLHSIKSGSAPATTTVPTNCITRMIMEKNYLLLLPEQLTIKGIREENYIELNEEWLGPVLSLKIVNHSPTGFNWGYGGSGPAQLALAILMEYLPVKIALDLYQDFKWGFIAALPQNDFELTVNLKQIITNILNQKTEGIS